MSHGKYDVFVFDFYGTLVDIRTNEEKSYLWRKCTELYGSMGAHYCPAELKRTFRRMIEEEAEKLQEEGERKYGEAFQAEPDLTVVFRRLYEEKGISCPQEQAAITANFFRTLSRQKLRVYDGVRETLLKLREGGKKVYLLSNAQRDFTRPEIELTGLTDCFEEILISAEEGCKKPSPVFYRVLIERYSLQTERCLMMGNDADADVKGAAAVGMDTLYIHTDTSPQLKGEPDATYTVLDGDWNKAAKILLTRAGL
ncbi:MAG: HAD family hydrolase [Acetatifactor sp.]|nr:HAD family hydrolase [Acetatifactor sp.]